MKRIKEIKSDHTEEELYKKFPWLAKADIENAVVSVMGDMLVWEYGIWHDGMWRYGKWKDGWWKNGVWEHGFWYNGTWEDGERYNGFWENGIWKKGVWHDGEWYDGEWYDGVWYDGTWKKGTWHRGYIDGVLSTEPPNIAKISPHEKKQSDENHYIRQIKNPTLYNLADKLSRM